MSRLRWVLVSCYAIDLNYMETTVDKTGFIAERKQQQHVRMNKRCFKATYRLIERGTETRFPVCFMDTKGESSAASRQSKFNVGLILWLTQTPRSFFYRQLISNHGKRM